MKRFICVFLCMMCVFSIPVSAADGEVLHYDFESGEILQVVTNTLSDGKSMTAQDGQIYLDGTFGLKLGEVKDTFTVSALIKIQSEGGTNTVFFKDMDGSGNKWTGILSAKKKPSFWTHGDGFAWTTVASGNGDLGKESYVTYVENNGIGTMYVDGEKIGTGSVAKGNGTLYLGATYWSADAVVGYVYDVKVYNRALSANEVMADYEQFVDFENAIVLPSEVIGDIELPEKIASKKVTWTTSDSDIITTGGKVTRHTTDKTVVLSAYIGSEKIKDYTVTVLKTPNEINDDVILSYIFGENDGEIIHDVSGNGNHAASFNNLALTKDGALFDGVDDYVKMPEGVLYGHDDITISMTFKPDASQKHVFAYGFGNTSSSGYMFLNPSRPDSNLIRFAATRADYRSEREVVSLPGIRKGEWANVTVTLSKDGEVNMYIDGDWVMDGEMKMTVSSLGKTKSNYIGKSLYDSDPYFAGTVSEFTVYNSVLSDDEIASLYKKEKEYAEESQVFEYIESVSFENGIDVILDTNSRNDVKIGVVVFDENNNIIEAQIVSNSDEINITENGTICVFAFDEEHNIPGSFYLKGNADGFEYEYTPGKIKIVSDRDYSDGIAIVAGYDFSGTLTGVAMKKTDLSQGDAEEMSGCFDNAVEFKLLYWNNLESMAPIE